MLMLQARLSRFPPAAPHAHVRHWSVLSAVLRSLLPQPCRPVGVFHAPSHIRRLHPLLTIVVCCHRVRTRLAPSRTCARLCLCLCLRLPAPAAPPLPVLHSSAQHERHQSKLPASGQGGQANATLRAARWCFLRLVGQASLLLLLLPLVAARFSPSSVPLVLAPTLLQLDCSVSFHRCR